MLVTLNVPDELAAALSLANGDPAHAALEAIALEAFRERRIEIYSAEDFEHDIADLDVAPPAA